MPKHDGIWVARAMVVVAALASWACGRSQDHAFRDQGMICVWPSEVEARDVFGSSHQPVSYRADQPVTFTVMMPTCLSSSCSKDLRANCAVTMAGPGQLQVSSQGSFREEGNTCTADCGFLIARCTSAALAAGSYSISHGAERLTLTIPATTKAPCAGDAP